MSELPVYAELGLRHILDPRGLDHVLFVIALTCGYQAGQWRALLWVVTAFTLGHSVTLALAVTGVLALPAALIELLIPLTIVVTAAHGMLRAPKSAGRERWLRPALAGVFGLVHGAGFANYLKSLFVEDLAMPLLGFNLGLEMGQLVVVLGSLAVFAAVDALSTPRRRTVAVSTLVALVAAGWTLQRLPLP